jgi:hypothetical protein
VANWTTEELSKIARVARSVALAVAGNDDGDPSQVVVEVDVEAVLQSLMFFAAGIIGQNTTSRRHYTSV